MSFSRIPHLRIFCSCCLVVDGTVDGKDDKEEKTREVFDIRMYYFSWNVVIHVESIKNFLVNHYYCSNSHTY